MKIERAYPPEIAAARELLFEVLEYEASHAVDPHDRERRCGPIVEEIMKTEIHARIRCVLEPDDHTLLMLK